MNKYHDRVPHFCVELRKSIHQYYYNKYIEVGRTFPESFYGFSDLLFAYYTRKGRTFESYVFEFCCDATPMEGLELWHS